MVLSNLYHPRHWLPTIENYNKIEGYLSAYSPSDEMRDLLALPVRLGGIVLTNPTSAAEVEFSASTQVSDPLKDAILRQCFLSIQVTLFMSKWKPNVKSAE